MRRGALPLAFRTTQRAVPLLSKRSAGATLGLEVRASHQLAALRVTAATESCEVVPSPVCAATKIASLATARDEAAREKANAVAHRTTGLMEIAVRRTDRSQAARATRTAPAATS